MIAKGYEQIYLGPGYRATLTVRLAQGAAQWDWALETRDVDFSATFTPDDGGSAPSPTPIAQETRYLASEGPVEGRFALPPGSAGGTLRLCWSNYFSFVRGKTLSYRLELPPDADTPDVKIH